MPEPCEVIVEVPAWTFVKRRPDGTVDFVSPLPTPFNYGSVVGTISADGDPLDAVVLGERLPRGARVETVAYAEVDFLDAGVRDPKRICGRRPSRLDRARLIGFFLIYAIAKRALHRSRGVRGETRYRGLRFL